jgi:hypothetical protein
MSRADRPVARTATAAVLVAVLLTIAAGCSHIPRPHWPWHRKPAQPPQEVHELVITFASDAAASEPAPASNNADAAFPQYWKGNILVVDMKSASAPGSIVLKPREHTVWPVRIAFRVMPGQFGALEVRANQRVVLPITTAGTKPVDLELAPGVFIMKTPQITVSWGPADQSSGN